LIYYILLYICFYHSLVSQGTGYRIPCMAKYILLWFEQLQYHHYNMITMIIVIVTIVYFFLYFCDIMNSVVKWRTTNILFDRHTTQLTTSLLLDPTTMDLLLRLRHCHYHCCYHHDHSCSFWWVRRRGVVLLSVQSPFVRTYIPWQ